MAQDNANFENVREGTSSVRKFESGKSEFGILDMCGNVGEWVNDWYDLYQLHGVHRLPLCHG